MGFEQYKAMQRAISKAAKPWNQPGITSESHLGSKTCRWLTAYWLFFTIVSAERTLRSFRYLRITAALKLPMLQAAGFAAPPRTPALV